jgi:hypothetical protein
LQNSIWFDPANWTNNRTYGTDQLSFLAEYFEKPLKATNFDPEAVAKEWKSFRTFVSANYRGLDASSLWEKVFQYKRSEYPSLCMIAELGRKSLQFTHVIINRQTSLTVPQYH